MYVIMMCVCICIDMHAFINFIVSLMNAVFFQYQFHVCLQYEIALFNSKRHC